jgi:predicted PurR-regulated permease PerM
LETLYFIVIAVVLYFLADKVLDMIEVRRGSRFEHRSIMFFFILLGMAVSAFWVLQRLTGHGKPLIGG